MEFFTIDLVKGIGLILLEMISLFILMFVIKMCMDRNKHFRTENWDTSPMIKIYSPLHIGSSSKIDEHMELLVEEGQHGKTLTYTVEGAKKEEPHCGNVPQITYNIQDDQNFVCLLDKKS